jgi:2-polyprenyl-6-methoxyphenol hydroxylase-like FAD-dependent oxidoreductase
MPGTKSTVLVLGSGMAGMLAARVLSDSFSEVVMIDRRPIDPGTATFSAAVPQAAHLHVLLKRGQLVLERLFPGILAELAAGGGPMNDWGNTTFWVNPYGVHALHPTEITTLQFSREALDAAVLARVAARGNIRAVSARVTRLLGEARPGRITGVVVSTRAGGAAQTTELRADLVVDCRGRSSPIVDEITALGYPEPAVSRVDNEMGYSSCVFRLARPPRWELVYIQVRPGLINRGGAACHIAPDRLVVTLGGTGDDRPSAAPDEFLAFAASAHPELAAQMVDATPLGPPRLWRSLSNVRRHFGDMRAWPSGLLVLGDALCAFNPVYGQGMTVAAVEAEALGELLATLDDPTAVAWEPRFQRQLERELFIPWLMSTMEDMRNHKFASPSLVVRALQGYMDLVLRGAVTDPALHLAFLRVMHMMRSPLSLMAPGALARVLVRTARRALGSSPASASVLEMKRSPAG